MRTLVLAAGLCVGLGDSMAIAQNVGRHMDFHPSVSPDGAAVVFYSYREPDFPDLFIVDRRSLRERSLTSTPDLWEIEPEWSPVANRIAFSRGRSMAELEVVVRDLETDEETTLGPGVNVSWSPDGERLVWARDGAIWIARRDGRNARVLPLEALGEGAMSEPSWSPDGAAVLFVHEASGDTSPARFEVYAFNLETQEVTRLTRNGFQETHPSLTTDGQMLIFASALISRNPRVYGVAVDQSGDVRQLSADSASHMHYFPSLGRDDDALFYEAGEWSEQRFYIYERPLDRSSQARRLTGPEPGP